ncbi:MAG: ABC transporter ATP-binding protein [Candidatus Thermoplasmatota archaeon]|nr:ABC transporter ATP-binding protein [Candidatus Thermoplasmatota archaeon]
MISVSDLVMTYDGVRRAVDNLSFQVGEGEIYGLLGKNGAGKTTTIKILTTLIPPVSGKATVDGMDVRTHASTIRKMIGVVQQGESFDFTTVERSFDIYSLLWEIPRGIAERRKAELIEFFDLARLRKSRVFELSGGEKKRLQVAREFMHDMKVLFLDEPTVGMDPIMRRDILNYIKSRAKDGLTVVFTTHILEEADYICNRIGIMNNGRLVAEGTSSHLKQNLGSLRKLTVESTAEITKKQSGSISDYLNSLGHPFELEVSGKMINVIASRVPKILSPFLAKLSELSVEIDHVSVVDPSLDDVFLEVMKN